jgi:hypothetical protein
MGGRIEKAAPKIGAAWADCNEDGLLDLAHDHWNHAPSTRSIFSRNSG